MMNDEIPTRKSTRLALTKNQAAEGLGHELVELSRAWLADGKFTSNELEELRAWLAKVPSDSLPAIRYIKEEVERYSADGTIYDWKLGHLQAALIRVIPPKERDEAKTTRSEAARVEWEQQAPEREAASEVDPVH